MAIATSLLVVFLVLVVWRLIYAIWPAKPRVRCRLLLREYRYIDPLDLVPWPENDARRPHFFTPQDRARNYLQRIVEITGAIPTGQGYLLDVGTTRFHVRDGYIERQRNPNSEYEKTCFQLPHSPMPRAEQIATALLQLKSNPALFDRWAAQNGAYKANGEGFSRVQ